MESTAKAPKRQNEGIEEELKADVKNDKQSQSSFAQAPRGSSQQAKQKEVANMAPPKGDGEINEFQLRLIEANQDLMMFLPYEEKLQNKTDLDLAFIMDITGSMASWVEASKKELQQII